MYVLTNNTKEGRAMYFIGFIFILVFCSVQAKSFLSEPEVGQVWTPGEDVSMDEWLRCQGQPCDSWQRVKVKMALYKAKVMGANETQAMELMDFQDDSHDVREDTLDGCTIPTEEQMDLLLAELDEEEHRREKRDTAKSRHKRKLVIDSPYFSKRWKLPIHWKFDDSSQYPYIHTARQRAKIRGGFSHIEAQTCVKFKELEANESTSEHYVIVTKRDGCFAVLGRSYFTPQRLNLGFSCTYSFGTIVHEIGHTLGLNHEHQREDRDDHIRVLSDNVQDRYKIWYSKLKTEYLGVPYDVGSVMHYNAFAFSANGKETMETIDPLEQNSLGHRNGLSFLDAKMINFAYCMDQCSADHILPCQHGGYQDPENCSVCRCPDGFSGPYCQDLQPSDDGCGGDIQLTPGDNPKYISTPDFSSKKLYKDFQNCNWRIQVPSGYHVELNFVDEFGVFCGSEICLHWVEVKSQRRHLIKGMQGSRFCCKTLPSAYLRSEDQEMVVTFRANWTTFYASSLKQGFKARLTAVPEGAPPAQPSPVTPPPSTLSPSSSPTTTEKRHETSTVAPTITPGKYECPKMDIVFVLDSSGSVTYQNWMRVLSFMKKFILNFNINPDSVRVGAVSFGTEGTANIKLTDHEDSSGLTKAINDKMPFLDQWTNTAAGLKVAREEVFAKSPRVDARKVIIMMTDGESNRNQKNTLPEAKTTREAGIEILVLAVGGQANLREALDIAGEEGHMFAIKTFADFMTNKIDNMLFNYLCEPVTIPTQSWGCSFEKDEDPLCGMSQSSTDDFDWTRQRGRTPSRETGPNAAAHERYYIFIEASNPRKSGDKAVIVTPAVQANGTYCIQYKYHMYGHHINSLRVLKISASDYITTIKKYEGNLKEVWHQGMSEIHMDAGDKIAFEGVRGNEFSGDIALDDLHMKRANCKQ